MSTQFNRQKHFYFKLFSLFKQFLFSLAQSAGAVEYTDCFSTEG